MWKSRCFWKSNNKEKLLEKSLEDDRNVNPKQYPKNLVYFDFPKPLKNNKNEIFEALKHFKNLILKPENREIFALENLSQNPKEMGFI